ncbi:MAG: MerR family transcriptional regulator [Planctomycetaceae bacterium]|jgi:tetratricopeptide (TPR) repeat protein|nr:MerR family transcriptional regulator [Planctomycetaceae bacterium]
MHRSKNVNTCFPVGEPVKHDENIIDIKDDKDNKNENANDKDKTIGIKESRLLLGKVVYFLGKLKASSKFEASAAVRACGGEVARNLSAAANIIVVGEDDILSCDWNLWNDQLDAATKAAFESGRLEIISEASFWCRYCGGQTAEISDLTKSLFTPSMLSEITKLPLSIIRQFERRRLIVPVRQIRKLNYYDTDSVLTLRIVRNMLDAGVTPAQAAGMLQKIKLNSTDDNFYNAADIKFNGRDLFIVTKNGAVDLDGQYLFQFEVEPERSDVDESSQVVRDRMLANYKFDDSEVLERLPSQLQPAGQAEFLLLPFLDGIFEGGTLRFQVQALYDAACQAELSGDLGLAVEIYRTIIVIGGSTPQLNFQIAELLYRRGELLAARERYFIALEQDEEFVEARANLGCVLAELGEDKFAIAAFRGALKFHPDYAEVHFHLGMLLNRTGQFRDALEHLQLFVDLTPDSPWIAKANDTIKDIEKFQN